MIKSFEHAAVDSPSRGVPARPQGPPPHRLTAAPHERVQAGGESRLLIHAAIIMDGSGRWAERRGLRRSAGHRAGAAAVCRSVQAAPGLGIGTLTLHAFSSDNWQRSAPEVRELMTIFEEFLRSSAAQWTESGIRTSVIGRRDRVNPSLVAKLHGTIKSHFGKDLLPERIIELIPNRVPPQDRRTL